MKICKRKYILEYIEKENMLCMYNENGGHYLDMPLNIRIAENGEDMNPVFSSYKLTDNLFSVSFEDNDKLSDMKLDIVLNEDTMEFQFTSKAKKDIYIESAELFRKGTHGMYMVDCIKRFAPAPRNNFGVNRSFENVFCDCTMNAYFAPPPLNFAVGNITGYVGFGLLELPDSYEFSLTPSLGVLVENRGGKLVTKKENEYKTPKLLVSFPKDGWDSISLFRKELDKRGLLPEKRSNVPVWWNEPLVVTYGDQMMELQYNWYSDEDWGCDKFNDEWLNMWFERAEEKLGDVPFTVVVDAFWQYPYSTEGKVCKERFSGMRKFIDKCHAKNHHVLLWTAPLIVDANYGFVTLAEKMGVLSEDMLRGGIVEGKYYVDFTADNISEYFDEISRTFFSDGKDCLNCDGLKMDFLANLRNPALEAHYKNPENGIGIKEMYRFYNEFQKAAVKVKPDVCLNGSGCDPRFATVMAMNRLHDIQNVYEERELRAKASILACPDLTVDSDGAIMLSSWVRETYIKAVIYSTPSLYYVNKFHDGVSLSGKDMRSLGKLLSLSAKKVKGEIIHDENGDWSIIKDGKLCAKTYGADAVFVYDGKSEINIFSWTDRDIDIPIYTGKNCEYKTVFVNAGKLISVKVD